MPATIIYTLIIFMFPYLVRSTFNIQLQLGDDRLFHFSEFALWAFIFSLEIKKLKEGFPYQTIWRKFGFSLLLISGLFIASLDELIQFNFEERLSDISDIYYDLAGVMTIAFIKYIDEAILKLGIRN